MTARPREPLDPERFRHLPEPVDLDRTVTSEDTVVVAPDKDEETREREWFLRTAG
jgi:hypothetical protein